MNEYYGIFAGIEFKGTDPLYIKAYYTFDILLNNKLEHFLLNYSELSHLKLDVGTIIIINYNEITNHYELKETNNLNEETLSYIKSLYSNEYKSIKDKEKERAKTIEKILNNLNSHIIEETYIPALNIYQYGK